MKPRPPLRRRPRRPGFTQKQIDKAVRLHERFTGHDASERGELHDAPRIPPVLTKVGPCVAIEYIATREGERATYRHTFDKKSRPALATDGDHLYLIGGSYRFTDRGIVDIDPRTGMEIEEA